MSSFRSRYLRFMPTLVTIVCALFGTDANGQPPPKKTIKVAAPVAGIVAKVHAKEGDRVKAGALLVQLDDRLAKLEVEKAAAKLAMVEAGYQIAKARENEWQIKFDRELKLFQNPAAVGGHAPDIVKIFWEQHQFLARSSLATVAVAKAELERATILRDLHKVRSPVDGIIAAVAVTSGEGAKELQGLVALVPVNSK